MRSKFFLSALVITTVLTAAPALAQKKKRTAAPTLAQKKKRKPAQAQTAPQGPKSAFGDPVEGAEEPVPTQPADAPMTDDPSMQADKSFYGKALLGYAKINYPTAADTTIDALNDVPDVTHFPFGLDVAGYFKLSPWVLLGGSLNVTGDSWSLENESLTFYHLLFGVSAQIHPLGEPGSGPFVRADLGLASLSATYKLGGLEIDSDTDVGFGTAVGAGYSIPINGNIGIALEIQHSYRRIKGDSYNITGFFAGLTF